MNDERHPITITETARKFLEKRCAEWGLANLEECLDQLIDQAIQDEPRKLTFKVDERTCVFRRLTDSQYREAGRTAIAFNDPHPISIYKIGKREFDLAQTYAACCSLFGERGRLFDDWKGGFSFPLTLEIEGISRKPAYLINVIDYRGGVDPRLKQTVAKDDPRLTTNQLYQHDDPELTTERFCKILFHLIGFLEGYAGTFPWKTPFLLAVDSNNLLYGFSPTEGFFHRAFDEPEDYSRTRKELSVTLPAPIFYSS